MVAACIVCNGKLEKGQRKICLKCHPFWDKAKDIDDKAKKGKRKPVLFATPGTDENIAAFAREMKEKWEDKAPYFLCKYTWLPMLLESPKAEDDDDDEKKERKDLLKYLGFSPDRIDSKKNYEPNNIEVCSYLGNIMKTALSEEAFDSVITGMVEGQLTIGRNEQLANMLVTILSDFYAETKLSREGILELFEAENNKSDEV